MNAAAVRARLLLLLPICCVLVGASSLFGPRAVSWAEISGRRPGRIYWQLRVPRTTKAACAGAGLALSGVLLQALFRNPLATPYTLGIAGGASLGAAVAMLSGIGGYVLGVPRVSLLAFGGAIGAMSLVYLMSRLRAGRDMTRLLLAGVCISYMCSAGVMLATFLANQPVTNRIVIWIMGSLEEHRSRAALEIAALLIPVAAYACYAHRALDLLSMGDEIAAARGVDVGRTIWTSFLLVGALTAVIVANCGPIAFVGLMVPHIARVLIGVHALPLVLASIMIGGAFLAVCDGFVRLYPYQPPVGVVTNLLGAAFFFYLLATRDISFGSSR